MYDSTNTIIPQGGTPGGNYVDVSLKVIVMMDADTALVQSNLRFH
jgi:hypothetical protein